MEGFFLGESIPVNEKLSEIFLQLQISEKSGRGVPKIDNIKGLRRAVAWGQRLWKVLPEIWSSVQK